MRIGVAERSGAETSLIGAAERLNKAKVIERGKMEARATVAKFLENSA